MVGDLIDAECTECTDNINSYSISNPQMQILTGQKHQRAAHKQTKQTEKRNIRFLCYWRFKKIKTKKRGRRKRIFTHTLGTFPKRKKTPKIFQFFWFFSFFYCLSIFTGISFLFFALGLSSVAIKRLKKVQIFLSVIQAIPPLLAH